MKFIIGNYGNDSLALLQWAIEQNSPNTYFISVDTGWAPEQWRERVQAGEAYAKQHNITPIRLKSPLSFTDLIRDRKEFPNKKFQWCAGFLKGVAINDYLDQVDPSCEATLLFGKRRAASRANQHLKQTIEASEHYNDRTIFYPLIDASKELRDTLIQRANFPVLSHRSLECDPCIHSSEQDFQNMSARSIEKVSHLESEINKTMFTPLKIKVVVESAIKSGKKSQKNYNELFDMGCGSPWGCGE